MHQRAPHSSDGSATDAEIARQVAGGDPDALRLLVQRHNQLLFRTARSILKDEAEAEDAVQVAYMRSLRAIDRFRGDAKLSTWLVRIVVNESIARTRRRDRTARFIRFESEIGREGTDAMNASESPHERPEQAMMRAEACRQLEAAIDALPDTLRCVFVLRAVEEMPDDEIAAALRISNVAVRTRFFRAKSALRATLVRDLDVTLRDVFAFRGARCTGITARVLRSREEARADWR